MTARGGRPTQWGGNRAIANVCPIVDANATSHASKNAAFLLWLFAVRVIDEREGDSSAREKATAYSERARNERLIASDFGVKSKLSPRPFGDADTGEMDAWVRL